MNISSATLTFGVINDIVIVGSNPEMADMSNPNGNIEGLSHYIIGETPDGRRFVHNAVAYTRNGYALNSNPTDCAPDFDWSADSQGMTVERLERLADYLNANHPILDTYHWVEVQAAYGSEAYQRDGWEARMLSSEIGGAVDVGEISPLEGDTLRVASGLLS